MGDKILSFTPSSNSISLQHVFVFTFLIQLYFLFFFVFFQFFSSLLGEGIVYKKKGHVTKPMSSRTNNQINRMELFLTRIIIIFYRTHTHLLSLFFLLNNFFLFPSYN